MKTFIALFVPALAVACASTTPSRELVDARSAYEDARLSAAAQHTPDRLLEAKQALDRAELAHRDDPGSFDEKNLAYIATRRSELAVVYGSFEADRRDREAAESAYKAKLEQNRRELEQTQAELGSTKSTLAGTRAELEKARSETAAALASLGEAAKVRDEERGTVITLDGSVLFASGKSTLLPIAEKKLDEVAKALTDTAADRTISVEGHTDSNGNDAFNQKLSQDRADAVRTYLVQRGVKSDHITAVGKGETTPVASNDTAEGRANNRRVEIIIQKASPSR
jgi:outer membrane protein OmpA-like peptidoglycan-associated protein